MGEYKSLKELYEALVPALNVKVRTYQSKNNDKISREDIWDYLKNTRWKKASDLSISEMVSDIINVSDYDLERYMRDRSFI